MNSLTVRKFESADRPSIEQMSEQVVEQGDVFPFESIRGVLDYWFSPGSNCYVATQVGKVNGSYVIKPNLPDRCAHIANAGYLVDQRCRGQGVGLAMAEHSITEARRLGFRAIQFNIVVATNTAAIALWNKMEFATIGTIPDGFRLPSGEFADLLIMHREL